MAEPLLNELYPIQTLEILDLGILNRMECRALNFLIDG